MDSTWCNHHPFIIAGPCSAESCDQVLNTASQCAQEGVSVFRAGVWKPRTRPNSFSGFGVEALEWLQLVKKKYPMKIATEVASATHVELALKYGVDIIWIGARSTTNPFTVQEIADSLRGENVIVLVKNPVNPDLDLWIGAFERLQKNGIVRVGAIHRGFSVYGTSKYRNEPHWQLPLELKQKMPEIPLFCDPSHICGCKDLLFEVSQEALDLQYSGLMIETHLKPSSAFSDSQQQITPLELKKILQKLIIRKPAIQSREFNHHLSIFRDLIDQYDKKLITILAERMNIVEQIGRCKKKDNVTIFQPERWNTIMQKVFKLGNQVNLNPLFLKKIFQTIHDESIQRQTDILDSMEKDGGD